MKANNREAGVPPVLDAPHVHTTAESLADLRLPANYGAGLGVKKILSHVRVGRPNKTTFFRARRGGEWQFCAAIYQAEADEVYIVDAAVQGAVEGSPFRYVTLHAAITRNGDVFLIPVPLPGEDGRRNPWHQSLDEAVVHSSDHWVRILANMLNGAYDVYEAQGKLPEPEWPAVTMEELVNVAFRGRAIRDLDHPVVQSLQGRA